ncbi:MAG TPA: hypothetical protein VK658_08755 [Chryseolinea sp.]|nr:hypothetical protein [Chryseolinea sp.]
MTATELKDLLISRKWEYKPVVYSFNATTMSTSSGVMTPYEIEEKDDLLLLTNTDLRNKQPFRLTVKENHGLTEITIAPVIIGDTGFSPIILTEIIPN